MADMLCFDPATGECKKRIGGAAVLNKKYIGVEITTPELKEFAAGDLRFLKLENGQIVKRDPTAEELAARESEEARTVLQRDILDRFFYLENRLRALEGKSAVTRGAFLAGLVKRS